MTADREYIEKHTVVRNGQKSLDREAKFFVDQSPKQRVVILVRDKFLTQLQGRAITLYMDKAIREGTKPHVALEEALRSVARGKLKLPNVVDKKAKENLVTLSAIRAEPDSLGEKQQLIELRNRGSLSPQLTRKAAILLTKGLTLVHALCELEQEHLLGPDIPVPGKPKEEADGDPADEGAGKEGSQEDPNPDDVGTEAGADGSVQPTPEEGDGPREGAGDDEPPPAKIPKTIADLAAATVADLKKQLPRIKAKPALLQLLIEEESKGDDARVTAVEAIVGRLEEVGATDAEIEGARRTAAQEPDGDPRDDFKE